MLNHTTRAPLLLACFAAATPAAAASTSAASLLVVHGIPGRDLAETLDPALPVDVLVNKSVCLLKNMAFGDIAGPFDLPAGSYAVAVSLADPIKPCAGTPVISASVTLRDGEFAAFVAQLSNTAAAMAAIYPVAVAPVGAGKQVFFAVHAADAGAISVAFQSTGTVPEKFEIKLDRGDYGEHTASTRQNFQATVLTGGKQLAPTAIGNVGTQSVVFSAVVGSASTGSVTILTKQLHAVH
jgi:hypothetical protein